MRLFGFGGGGESKEQEARREASEKAISEGGLPLDAVDRLTEAASLQGTDHHLFTSDLSVNELGAVRHAGYSPLGQVMGCSIYQVGWQFMAGGITTGGIRTSGELEVLSEAYAEARRLALRRLRDEAALLHADGVVGVRLTIKNYSWATGLLEYMAIGTAIRLTSSTVPEGEPFLSDLSGQDFWALAMAGYRPVGLVSGNCSYFCYPKFMPAGWRNQERTDYTQAMYEARELAVGRMEIAARSLNAHGVIGGDVQVTFERPQSTNLPDALYHFTAIGTAIRKADPLEPISKLPILPVVSARN